MKVKYKQASLKNNNGSVVIIYKVGGKEMKFPTGVSLSWRKRNKAALPMYAWDKDLRNIKHMKNITSEELAKFNILKSKIDEKLNYANQIIFEYYERDITISPEDLKLQLELRQNEKTKVSSFGLVEEFKNFSLHKLSMFKSKGKKISHKDYNSTYNLLEAYEAELKGKIYISSINRLWLEKLIIFCRKKHPAFIGERKIVSRGDMKNSTIDKRFAILCEFFNYMKEYGLDTISLIDNLKKVKKTSLPKETTNKESLTIEEIHLLHQHICNNEHQKPIKDMFVFLCLTGIRYQDLANFDREFIANIQGGKAYIRKASKTGIDYNIPLCQIALDLLERYGYELPKFSDQYGNREIKEILKEVGVFNQQTQIMNPVTGKYKKRYEAITIHKARNTFITNLIDNTPLNILMKYTGHRKLSTLQTYVDTNRKINLDYIKIFDLP